MRAGFPTVVWNFDCDADSPCNSQTLCTVDALIANKYCTHFMRCFFFVDRCTFQGAATCARACSWHTRVSTSWCGCIPECFSLPVPLQCVERSRCMSWACSSLLSVAVSADTCWCWVATRSQVALAFPRPFCIHSSQVRAISRTPEHMRFRAAPSGVPLAHLDRAVCIRPYSVYSKAFSGRCFRVGALK